MMTLVDLKTSSVEYQASGDSATDASFGFNSLGQSSHPLYFQTYDTREAY